MSGDSEDDSSKTEEPTEKRLQDARDKGQVISSRDVINFFNMGTVLAVVVFMTPGMMRAFTDGMTKFIQMPHAIEMSPGALGGTLTGVLADIGLMIGLPLASLLVIGIASGVVQNGFSAVSDRIMPDISKINPMTGFKRIFAVRSLIELMKNLAKMGVIGTISWKCVSPRIQNIELMIGMDTFQVMLIIADISKQVLIGVLIFLFFLAIFDYGYEYFSFMKKMRMSKQEMKDEHKQSEGDPMIKGRLRQIRMQKARQRMMTAVPTADVVVTNPTHYACALKYDSAAMDAPRLVAKGADLVAFRIRDLAEKHEIPIMENPPLARALYASVEIDREIPPEHYKAVAEVISYVYKLKQKVKRK